MPSPCATLTEEVIACQLQVNAWLESVKDNVNFRILLSNFFSSDNLETKLRKKDIKSQLATEELPLPHFSIIKLFSPRLDKHIFRLIGNKLTSGQFVGTNGHFKISFPIVLLDDKIAIHLHHPLALKILPKTTSGYNFLNNFSKKVLAQQYGEDFAFGHRNSSTTKLWSEQLTPAIEKEYLGMPLFNAPNLCEYFESTDYLALAPLDKNQYIAIIIAGVLKELKKLHHRKVIHCDIKPENILFDHKSYKIHLIDLDGCKPIDTKTARYFLGTCSYFPKKLQAIRKIENRFLRTYIDTYLDLYALATMLKKMWGLCSKESDIPVTSWISSWAQDLLLSIDTALADAAEPFHVPSSSIYQIDKILTSFEKRISPCFTLPAAPPLQILDFLV